MKDKRTLLSRLLQIVSGSGMVMFFYVVVTFTTISPRVTKLFFEAKYVNQATLSNLFITLLFASILTYLYFRAIDLLTLHRWHDETRLIFASTFSLFGHLGLVGIVIYPIFYGPGNAITLGLMTMLFYSLNLLLTFRFRIKEPIDN